MQDKTTDTRNVETSVQRSLRERIGLVVSGTDTKAAVAAIVEAEAAGVSQIWMTQGAPSPDTLTTFAAAAVQTQRVRMGTAIVPTYPRHPLALAQQVVALNDLAPDRVRLGIGPSHRPVIEGMYVLAMPTPMEQLNE